MNRLHPLLRPIKPETVTGKPSSTFEALRTPRLWSVKLRAKPSATVMEKYNTDISRRKSLVTASTLRLESLFRRPSFLEKQ